LSLRVVVAEDEPPALRHLLSALAEIPDVEVVGHAGNGSAAIALVRQHAPDLVILDIHMPGGSGLDVAAAISGPGAPVVMFLTAYETHAVGAFELEAADYLLKPVADDRLRQAIHRACRRIAAQAPRPREHATDAIWAPVRNGKVRIDAGSIYWIEAAGDYVLVHTATRSHMVRRFISDLEQAFDPGVLLRVHRSAMINVRRVRGVRRPARGRLSVILEDDIEVPVGARYTPSVAALLERLGA
jgi:two-component system, LytTR family, response regulator